MGQPWDDVYRDRMAASRDLQIVNCRGAGLIERPDAGSYRCCRWDAGLL
jgi:hypothetical protein